MKKFPGSFFKIRPTHSTNIVQIIHLLNNFRIDIQIMKKLRNQVFRDKFSLQTDENFAHQKHSVTKVLFMLFVLTF